jgi:hypothetical protein
MQKSNSVSDCQFHPDHGQAGSHSGPEVGFEEITLDPLISSKLVPQDPVSGPQEEELRVPGLLPHCREYAGNRVGSWLHAKIE